MKKRLREILSAKRVTDVFNSYDIVGNIAIIHLTNSSLRNARDVAETVMSVHKNVKTVLAQTSPVTGVFRLRKLQHITGEKTTGTVYREFGCSFTVDVEKCYFSPRLSHERIRIAGMVKADETIVNMFAGVGSFSIVIAKHSSASKVYSIDVNPVAIQYMQENIRVNRVYDKVIPILGDAKEVVEKGIHHSADRVLMPLPEKALEYLPSALLALKESGGWIHYYDFEHACKAEDPVEKVKQKVAGKLQNLDVLLDIPYGRVVRTTGPNWYQIVLDVSVEG